MLQVISIFCFCSLIMILPLLTVTNHINFLHSSQNEDDISESENKVIMNTMRDNIANDG
jgi:hypothetical protein